MVKPSQPARKTQAERRDESEQRLLNAAATIVERDGYNAATMQSVGAEAGYSRGLASQRFGSKDGLVRAVIAALSARLEARYAAHVAGVESPLARILALGEQLFVAVEEDAHFRAYFVMMAAAIANRLDLRDAFLEAHEGVRTQLRKLISEGQERGEIDPALHADSMALLIGSMQLGVCLEMLLDPSLDMADMRGGQRAAVCRMLSPQPPAPPPPREG
ncbi:TetR/AcrR family transcriptional regulator [Sandaracinobacteroides sp. A072]|uniref:TetR/AcrR family transcriptional regulator n=1 Tax=Sandaracinobacteroides sp. A072 TaxID=3461146 RepID=UPI0040412664